MRSKTRSILAAAALASILPLAGAEAMPGAPLPPAGDRPAVTLTAGGCGPFAHRGFYGYCRPNGIVYGGYGPGWGWRRPWGWGGGYGWRRGWGGPGWGWRRRW